MPDYLRTQHETDVNPRDSRTRAYTNPVTSRRGRMKSRPRFAAARPRGRYHSRAVIPALVIGFALGFAGSMPVGGPVAILVFTRGVQGRFRSGVDVSLGAAIASRYMKNRIDWVDKSILPWHRPEKMNFETSFTAWKVECWMRG